MRPIRDRRGAIAAASAVLLIIVVGFAGLAIDVTRIWMVNARLKTAIDAASLVAARQIGLPQGQRDAQVQAVYWANFSQNGRNFNYLGATVTDAVITPVAGFEDRRIQVSGTAVVPTTLFNIIQRRYTTVTDSAIAERQGTGLELALVLDVTGSLGIANMAAVRNASTDLINILYGDAERQPNLWVSVVPYTATVNIGRDRAHWLASGSLNPDNYLPTVWRGCVEARAGTPNYPIDADQDDTPPRMVPFRPHYWASNRTAYSRNAAGTAVILNARGQPRNRGDNSWTPPYHPLDLNSDITVPGGRINEPNPESPDSDAVQNARDNWANGPNLGCPRAILPLTRDKTPILEQIAALRHTHRGGTMANLGLQLGWATLSPRWRGDWNLNEFQDGQRLPLDYNRRNMSKAIVLMTDGENQWYDWPNGAPGDCATNNQAPPPAVGGASYPPCVNADLATLPDGPWTGSGSAITNRSADLTAYGRLRDNRLGVVNATPGPSGTAATDPMNGINARMTRLCEAVRADNRNITVYTITFVNNPSQQLQDLYRNCASAPENYFNAPTRERLSEVFRTIAGQLASLRLVE